MQLYFCDVTVLTVGFGDLHPSSAIGQGLILPYSVGGIINLSLVVTSIYHSMQTLGNENILRKHFQHVRERTQKRAVKHSSDLDRPEHVSNQQKDHCLHLRHQHNHRHNITSPDDHTRLNTVVRSISPILDRVGLSRRQRPVLMREERDRFNAMRRIQQRTHKFKSWFAVSVAVFAFILVWFIGAIVFWQCERTAQGLVFAEALYFTYISLLTIGYGNIVPKTHAGRCFFVIWSVFSVPIMTVLVGHMGDTFVDGFKRGASTLADFTVLPRAGAWKNWMRLAREWVQVQTGKVKYIEGTKERGQTKGDSLPSTNDDIDPETGIKRVSRSGDVLEKARTDESDGPSTAPDTTGEGMEEKLHTLHEDAILAALAREAEDVPENEAENVMPHPSILARAIATAIQLVAVDLRREHPKQYSWEEWVKFRRLIRLSEKLTYDPEKPEDEEEQEEEEEEERIFSWDWIGEDSPLVSELDESQWILERLCHALVRIEAWRGESLDKGKGKEKMVDGAGGDDAEKDDHNVGGEWRRRVDSRDISADLQAGAGGNGASRKQNDT